MGTAGRGTGGGESHLLALSVELRGHAVAEETSLFVLLFVVGTSGLDGVCVCVCSFACWTQTHIHILECVTFLRKQI